jgi:hypothetical protein
MYKGRPCHFVAIGNSCTIYENRPENPCKTFKCKWLTDSSIPEWLKPNLANVILYDADIEGMYYMGVAEAGEKLRVEVLDFVIKYVRENGINLYYQINGEKHWVGSEEFVIAMHKKEGNIYDK